MLAQAAPSPNGGNELTSGGRVSFALIVGLVLALVSVAMQVRPPSNRVLASAISGLCYLGIAEIVCWFFFPDQFIWAGPALAVVGTFVLVLEYKRPPVREYVPRIRWVPAGRGFLRREPRGDEVAKKAEPESGEASGGWESSVEPNNRDTMVISLRSRTGPQMIRGLACDVRGPIGEVPQRAIINKQGLANHEHVHYPDNFIPSGAVPMDGRYEVTWYEADENWEWRRLFRSIHDITLPPPPPNVHINIQDEYDTTVLISVGIDNPRREDITRVGLNFLVPDFVTELAPADQNSGRLPRQGTVMTTPEKLTDDEGNELGGGSK